MRGVSALWRPAVSGIRPDHLAGNFRLFRKRAAISQGFIVSLREWEKTPGLWSRISFGFLQGNAGTKMQRHKGTKQRAMQEVK
jgi:hypothetical protein